jgi:DNA-binding CsgD family transcriptional regulator
VRDGFAERAGMGALYTMATRALMIIDIAAGRYLEAIDNARFTFDEDAPDAGNSVLPEVVEAATRGGEPELASRAFARLDARASASATPWALGLRARSAAIRSAPDAAEPLYREAIEHLARTSVRTDLARAHLLYGEWLRREKRRKDAREQLRIAYEMFTGMGAEGFAERAGAELIATGETVRKRSVDTTFDLTPQEERVARLAAQGATSPEIAGQLFISSSTVEYHLRKVFRKLDITSRRQLPGTPFAAAVLREAVGDGGGSA